MQELEVKTNTRASKTITSKIIPFTKQLSAHARSTKYLSSSRFDLHSYEHWIYLRPHAWIVRESDHWQTSNIHPLAEPTSKAAGIVPPQLNLQHNTVHRANVAAICQGRQLVEPNW
jgi:hypothetical protein